VVQVLAEADGPMSLKEIRESVSTVLGGDVSLNSVQDFLHRRAKGPQAVFDRPSYGHYCLREHR
jgi:hypothetical protein